MRFKPWPRPTPYEDTPRKRAAYRRRKERERAALPLFAPVIAERQLCVAEEMVRRTGQWERQQQEGRRQRAQAWRRVRARLFGLDAGRRRAVRALWRVCPYPADPSYFGTLLHEIATGRIDPARPPWGGVAHAHPPHDTEPGELRGGVPADRPAHGRRRSEDGGCLRIPVLRQSGVRDPVPDLARAADRAERELLHHVEPSPARQSCREQWALGRYRGARPLLG